MLFGWCTDTVTVMRAGTKTVRGQSVPDWANATTHEVSGCSLQQTETETGFDATQRDPSESTARLICPYGSDVREGDRVSHGGRTWLVSGFPPGSGVRSPYGGASNLTVTLKEWRG